jgi:hypothetical protein
MASFPQLRTGAVAQYPLDRALDFQNQTVRFVDGTDQRYRDSGGYRMRWRIQLNALDEGEMASLEEFFEASQGAFGTFTFTDPWDGREYEDCSLELDELRVTTAAELRGMTQLTVVRNR